VNENTPLQRLGFNNASGTAFSSLMAQQPPKNSSSTFPDRDRVTTVLFSRASNRIDVSAIEKARGDESKIIEQRKVSKDEWERPGGRRRPKLRSKRHKRSSQSQIATRISFQTLSTETPPPDNRECEGFDPADVVPDGMKREETGQSTSRHVRALDQ